MTFIFGPRLKLKENILIEFSPTHSYLDELNILSFHALSQYYIMFDERVFLNY